MDDDISHIKQLKIMNDGKKILEDIENLDETFNTIKKMMDKTQTYLFGVYGRNPLYMSNSYDLRFHFIDGAMFGFISRKLKNLDIKNVQFGDDTELAIRYYDNDGKILNVKYLCVYHTIGTNKGGLQDNCNNRIEEQKIDSEKLVKLYPEYLSDTHEDLRTNLWLPKKKKIKKSNVELFDLYNIIS
jgi:hypothetical protein